MINLQIIAFLVPAIIINILLFLPAYFFKTDKLTDFTYSFTFILLTLMAFTIGTRDMTQIILLIMIILWAVRLATYLVIRIKKMSRDKRFDEVRGKFWSFLSFWVLQGFSAWLILIPTLIFLTRSTKISLTFAITGFVIWLYGILAESISDYQKYKFKSDPKNKDKWIETGLWKYSRHPNYFGEFLCWLGVYVFTLPALSLIEGILLLISPLYILWILTRVTGIPTLDKEADKIWGNDKKYQEYKNRTSLFVILPRKK